MRPLYRREPRTASSDLSIWRDLSETAFRNHLVALEEKTNAVPVPPQVFSLVESEQNAAQVVYLLPIEVEHSLADDFAYIAATGEGAQSVSAVCVEEHHRPPGLCIRFAAIDAIDEQLQLAIEEIGRSLETSSQTMNDGNSHEEIALLLNLIVRLHFQKLLGRLRSAKWKKPTYLARTHKKALWQDFDNLLHRVQFIYPKTKNATRVQVTAQLQEIATLFGKFENTRNGSDDEFTYMANLTKASYNFCTSPVTRDFAAKLENLPKATSQIAAAVKTLRQIEKIGAYYRIAIDLTTTSKRYKILFGNINFAYISPYLPVTTDIGYESWAKTLHVHAEVQLAVYYDCVHPRDEDSANCGQAKYSGPRIIGTSKYLCYLCYLFLKHHHMFNPPNTHGRLYDQWTIPDLADYDQNTREHYRSIVKNIDAEVVSTSGVLDFREGKRDPWRVEPMTSRQNLLLSTLNEI